MTETEWPEKPEIFREGLPIPPLEEKPTVYPGGHSEEDTSGHAVVMTAAASKSSTLHCISHAYSARALCRGLGTCQLT